MTNHRWRPGLLRSAMVFVLAVLAQPVHGQGADDQRLTRIRSSLPATAVDRIEATLGQARDEGLPVEPLLDKAVEGIAKGVPGDRIAGAVHVLATELSRAHTLLRDGAPPAATDVASVADALRRGVPEPAVRRLAGRSPRGEPVALAVHTLGDLVDQGVPTEEALAVLEAWRDRGGRSDELRELPAAVERLMRQGVLPEQAAAAVAGAMRGGGPPGLVGNPGKGPPNGPPIPPGAGPPTNRGKSQGKGKPPGGGGPPGGG